MTGKFREHREKPRTDADMSKTSGLGTGMMAGRGTLALEQSDFCCDHETYGEARDQAMTRKNKKTLPPQKDSGHFFLIPKPELVRHLNMTISRGSLHSFSRHKKLNNNHEQKHSPKELKTTKPQTPTCIILRIAETHSNYTPTNSKKIKKPMRIASILGNGSGTLAFL